MRRKPHACDLESSMKKILRLWALTLAATSALSLFGACRKEKGEITVYMPDGAPALALAGLMTEDTAEDGVVYKVVAPAAISTKVTYQDEEKNADLCVMPFTAATKLLGDGQRYTMLGTVTHGNLYLVAKEGAYSAENISSLIGKRVGVLQMNEVPGLTLKVTLQKLGIPYQEMTNDGGVSATKVNLLAISGADAVGAVEADCYLLAEPAATAQKKKGYTLVGDLQTLYGGENGYPQAVLVAKNTLLQKRPDWVEAFVAKVEGSATWLQSADGEEIVAAVSAHLEDTTAASNLKAPLLSSEVLSRCGVRFTYAATDGEELAAFLSVLLSVNAQAAAVPAQSFYWQYKK